MAVNLRGDVYKRQLVEQNARSALKISDRAYVLETGKIVLSGTAEELLHSDQVQKAYLGM